MKKEMLKYGRKYKKETYLTIPKDLLRYEWCKEAWEKVDKYACVFGRESEPQTM
jgi:hypothetical protein